MLEAPPKNVAGFGILKKKVSSELPFESSYVRPSLDPLWDLSGVEADSAPILVFLLAENTGVAINSGGRRSGREPLLFASGGRGRGRCLGRTRDTAGACCGPASGGWLHGGSEEDYGERMGGPATAARGGSLLHNLCGLDRKDRVCSEHASISSEPSHFRLPCKNMQVTQHVS